MNKNIKSEIAIGIIVAIAIIIGGSVWLENKNSQAGLAGKQYTSESMTCDNSEAASNSIVFLGDSITALEDWNASFKVPCIINAGISGNTTDDILSRLSVAIISKPKKLFLMIGINDLLRGKDISYVLTNYETILNKIKSESPNTIVYIQSVLPINNDISKIGTVDSQKIIALNDKLKSLAKENNVFFIDLYPSFCGADHKMYKKYAADGVHPSFAGYAVWKSMISQYME